MVNRPDEPGVKQETDFRQTGIGTGGRRTLHSSDILAGAREEIIEHRDERCRLRLTRMGKLILTRQREYRQRGCLRIYRRLHETEPGG